MAFVVRHLTGLVATYPIAPQLCTIDNNSNLSEISVNIFRIAVLFVLLWGPTFEGASHRCPTST